MVLQEPVEPGWLVARIVLPIIFHPFWLNYVYFVVYVVTDATQEHTSQEKEEKGL